MQHRHLVVLWEKRFPQKEAGRSLPSNSFEDVVFTVSVTGSEGTYTATLQSNSKVSLDQAVELFLGKARVRAAIISDARVS